MPGARKSTARRAKPCKGGDEADVRATRNGHVKLTRCLFRWMVVGEPYVSVWAARATGGSGCASTAPSLPPPSPKKGPECKREPEMDSRAVVLGIMELSSVACTAEVVGVVV